MPCLVGFIEFYGAVVGRYIFPKELLHNKPNISEFIQNLLATFDQTDLDYPPISLPINSSQKMTTNFEHRLGRILEYIDGH